MRILHVVRSLEIGGLERFVLDLAEEQCLTGHKVAIIEMCRSSGARMEVSDAIPDHLSATTKSSLISRALEIRKIIQRERVDLVHVHNTLALRHSVVGCLLKEIPLIMTKHGMEFSRGIHALVYGFPDHIACVSQAVLSRLIALFPALIGKCSVVPNGIKIRPRMPFRREEVRCSMQIPMQCLAFVWVGRFVKEKGLNGMIEAISHASRDVNWRIYLIGDGPLRHPLEDLVRNSGLANRIFFLGFRSDIREILPAFDVFLLPSLDEGLPIALLEAAAAGLPVVVSAVGGMPTVVRKENGWIVPPGSQDALTERFNQICRESCETLREIGARSADIAKDSFSISACAKRYMDLYESVVL